MKAIIFALAVLIAGGLAQAGEPFPSSDTLQPQEGLQKEEELAPDPNTLPSSPSPEKKKKGHILLKRVSSGDINPTTVNDGFEEKGEGNSPKQLLARDGKVTPPQPRVRRTRSYVYLMSLYVQE